MDNTIAEKAKVTPRRPSTLKEANFERNVWQVTADAGAHFDDVLKPEFWAHVGATLKPNDRIEVIAEDFAWFGELIVLDSDRLWAKVCPLRFVELAGKAPDVEIPQADYKVEYKGPTKKHCVIRQSDKQIVAEGIALKADAETWIKEHVAAIAR